MPTEYVLAWVCTCNSKIFTCTTMYLVCTLYVLGTCSYVHGKTKKQMSVTLRIDQWISWKATGAFYNYATSMHSNTRYIHTETYTRVAQYLLAGVGRPARVPQRPQLWPWHHWSRYWLEFPRCPCWLCKRLRLTLKAVQSTSWLPMESRLGLTVALLAATAALP